MSVTFTEYYPFDTPHGQPANAMRWSKMSRFFSPDGVAYQVLNGLTATISSGQATISTGAVLIHGYYAELQSPATFAVGTNGIIVAGVDLVNEVVSLYYKDGASDYNNLQRDDSVWEIPLYLVAGTTPTGIGNTVSGGRGLSTSWGFTPPPGTYIPLPSGQLVTYNVGTVRISQPCLLSMWHKGLINVPNAAVGLTVVYTMVLNAGLSTEQSIPGFVWCLSWPGGGPAAAAWFTISTHGVVWVPQAGKKTVGIRFQASGQASNAADNIIQCMQGGAISNV